MNIGALRKTAYTGNVRPATIKSSIFFELSLPRVRKWVRMARARVHSSVSLPCFPSNCQRRWITYTLASRQKSSSRRFRSGEKVKVDEFLVPTAWCRHTQPSVFNEASRMTRFFPLLIPYSLFTDARRRREQDIRPFCRDILREKKNRKKRGMGDVIFLSCATKRSALVVHQRECIHTRRLVPPRLVGQCCKL